MVSIRSAFSKMKERHKVIYWQQWQIKKEICILKRHKDFALHPLWKSHQALSAYRACDSIRLMYLLLRLVPHNSEVCIICSVFIPAGSSKHQHHSHITPVVINAQPFSKMMSAVRSEILPLVYAHCFSNWYKPLIQRVQSDFFQDTHSYSSHISLYDLPPVFSDLPHSQKLVDQSGSAVYLNTWSPVFSKYNFRWIDLVFQNWSTFTNHIQSFQTTEIKNKQWKKNKGCLGITCF